MADNSKLDVDIKKFLDKINSVPRIHPKHVDIRKGREDYLVFAQLNSGWPLTMARVEDITVSNPEDSFAVPVRIYTPVLNKKLPALIYYHGGGWQRGDIATHDSICRHLAKLSGCIVVSVKWRLAPEHRFPIGLNDCFAAYEWITSNGSSYNIDLDHIAIGGDSAGGNMAAVTAQRLRKTKLIKPVFQLLLYPALELSCSTWSYKEFAEGYFLSTDHIKHYVEGYINSPSDIDNPMVSPLKNEDLKGLPRTYIVTAGYDPLRAEAEEYAKKLRQAKVEVDYRCYEGMIHAFLHMNHTSPAVETALKEISTVLHHNLHQQVV